MAHFHSFRTMDNNSKIAADGKDGISLGDQPSELDSTQAGVERADKISHSPVFRAMILFQVFAYGSYSVLVHLCERDGAIMFSSMTMNLVLECIKLFFSVNIHLLDPARPTMPAFSNGAWLRKSLPYSVPGLLYFITNNLAVHIQLQMDPASYQILSNLKVVTTAVLYRAIIKQKLSRQQWFAVLLLFCGGVLYSLGEFSVMDR